MESINIKSLLLLSFSIFFISSVSAVVIYGEWQDGSQSVTINEGDSIGFDVGFGSMSPPMTINIKLYDSSYNLIYTFENNKVIEEHSFSNSYTINQDVYRSSGEYQLILQGSDAEGYTDSHTLTLTINPVQTPSEPTPSPEEPEPQPQPEEDTTPPTITDDYANDGTWVNSNQLITLTPTDSESGIKEVKYCMGKSCTPSTGLSPPYQLSYSASQDTIVRYQAWDNAGNPSAIGEFNVKIDKEIPMTNDNVPANWQSSSFDITLTVTNDNLSPVTTYYKFWPIGETEPSTWIQGNIIQITQDGEYNIKYYSKDEAGNIETEKISLNTAKLDTTSPTINIIDPEDGATYPSHKTELAYTVSDENLDSCQYSIDNGFTRINTTCAQVITGLQSVEGINTWIIYAKDIAGNKASASVTFAIEISQDSEQPQPDEPSTTKKSKEKSLYTYQYPQPEEEQYFKQFEPKIIRLVPKKQELSWFQKLILAIINFFKRIFSRQ